MSSVRPKSRKRQQQSTTEACEKRSTSTASECISVAKSNPLPWRYCKRPLPEYFGEPIHCESDWPSTTFIGRFPIELRRLIRDYIWHPNKLGRIINVDELQRPLYPTLRYAVSYYACTPDMLDSFDVLWEQFDTVLKIETHHYPLYYATAHLIHSHRHNWYCDDARHLRYRGDDPPSIECRNIILSIETSRDMKIYISDYYTVAEHAELIRNDYYAESDDSTDGTDDDSTNDS